MPKVLNKYHGNIPPGAVWIMRPGKWQNPFRVEDFPSREKCIDAYKSWMLSQPKLMYEAMRELRGKDLVCCCKPKACHGDFLLEVANGGY